MNDHRHSDQHIEHLVKHIHQTLHNITETLNTLNGKIDNMALVWDSVLADVARLKTVDDSIVALLTSFSQAVKDAVANAADLADAKIKIEQLDADLKGEADKIAAAVVANTPAEPPADPNAPTAARRR